MSRTHSTRCRLLPPHHFSPPSPPPPPRWTASSGNPATVAAVSEHPPSEQRTSARRPLSDQTPKEEQRNSQTASEQPICCATQHRPPMFWRVPCTKLIPGVVTGSFCVTFMGLVTTTNSSRGPYCTVPLHCRGPFQDLLCPEDLERLATVSLQPRFEADFPDVAVCWGGCGRKHGPDTGGCTGFVGTVLNEYCLCLGVQCGILVSEQTPATPLYISTPKKSPFQA